MKNFSNKRERVVYAPWLLVILGIGRLHPTRVRDIGIEEPCGKFIVLRNEVLVNNYAMFVK